MTRRSLLAGGIEPFPAERLGVRSEAGAASTWLVPPLCVLCLIWPALWNGYPIVFADTGTYLSQAMHRYLGWDRPPFYSLFIYPLHVGVTTWPVIVAQTCVTVLVLDVTRHACGVSRWWLLALTAFLAVASWLPWIVSELMPDLFTPLLVLLMTALMFARCHFTAWQRAAMTAAAAGMIATQQSSIPLTAALLVIFIPLRWIAGRLGSGPIVPRDRASLLAPLLAPVMAIAALMAMNAAGFGRLTIAPYGNVFLLARVIYDGPGMTVLRRDCPRESWRLCPYIDDFPHSADEFLWGESSPILLAGGHKAVSADANAIIRAALRDEPDRLIAATWDNTIEQLARFASGDGLETWDAEVGSWIDKDFPARERAVFHAARQQMGTLSVAPPLAATHFVVALAGIAAALVLLPIAWRRRHISAWFLAVALLTVPISAAITGGLSSPHDRYQSRIIWLPACVAFLVIPALVRRPRRAP
jgi:hypothetical protein